MIKRNANRRKGQCRVADVDEHLARDAACPVRDVAEPLHRSVLHIVIVEPGYIGIDVEPDDVRSDIARPLAVVLGAALVIPRGLQRLELEYVCRLLVCQAGCVDEEVNRILGINRIIRDPHQHHVRLRVRPKVTLQHNGFGLGHVNDHVIGFNRRKPRLQFRIGHELAAIHRYLDFGQPGVRRRSLADTLQLLVIKIGDGG